MPYPIFRPPYLLMGVLILIFFEITSLRKNIGSKKIGIMGGAMRIDVTGQVSVTTILWVPSTSC